jgi:hypothetical protein
VWRKNMVTRQKNTSFHPIIYNTQIVRSSYCSFLFRFRPKDGRHFSFEKIRKNQRKKKVSSHLCKEKDHTKFSCY